MLTLCPVKALICSLLGFVFFNLLIYSNMVLNLSVK